MVAILDLGIEAILDSPEMVAEFIESGCDINSDEACLSFDFSALYDFNSTYIDYYHEDNSTYEEYYYDYYDETESCQKRSILQIAVSLNSTNFIRELNEVHTFKSLIVLIWILTDPKY